MNQGEQATHKRRELHFKELHPSPNQAQDALEVLHGRPGILHCQVLGPLLLAVEYDLREVGFTEIQSLLDAAGLHLANQLIQKLKRALYCYAEETQLANMGCPRGHSNCTDQVFVTRYQRKDHGCRDARPDHWRRYL